MSRAGTRRTACALLVSLTVLVGLTAPATAHDVRVRHTLFGVHDRTNDSYATLHPGSVRLWEVNAEWQDVETSKGHYNWTRLDGLVDAARAAHVSITMVVAMTPSFYASEPSEPPTDIAAYRTFVKELMLRYGDRIRAYQVWNEANVINFWSGTQQEMAQLTKAMWETRNEFDPAAMVIAPPLTARLASQLTWLSTYESQLVDGVPVWHYYDVAAFNLYPLATYNGRIGVPEDSMRMLAEVKDRLHQAGVPRHKPIWNTEVNYGLLSGALAGQTAEAVSEARQAANVMRTYLLNAANGVSRVFWFRYDMHLKPPALGGGTIGNTLLSDPEDPTQVTPGGAAYLLAEEWMHGRLVGSRGEPPCPKDRHGTYTCTVRDSSGIRRIYWNPFHKATVKLAPHARKAHDVLGFVWKVKHGSKLTVTYRPVMVSR